MTEIPQAAIDAAATAIGYSIGRCEPSGVIARRALEAAAPLIVSHRETATAAAIAKAERERLLAAVTRFKTVLGQPVNGYLVDAVPFAAVLDVFAALPEGSRP
jgi:hypothetical protein